jgi:hypothetical protein
LDSARGEYILDENLAARVMGREERLSPKERPGEISLSGNGGPLCKALLDAGSATWHATDDLILYLLGVERRAEHRILIDLKPNDKSRVSLYRLRDVWGHSYDDWTPLALRLECLLGDDPRDNPETFKQRFTGPLETRDFIYEFLYVNGGAKGGKWTWGLVGRVNAALLWPDALRYFVKAINSQLIEENMEPFYQ